MMRAKHVMNTFGLNLVVVAVLRDSRVVVAVLRGSVGTIATCI